MKKLLYLSNSIIFVGCIGLASCGIKKNCKDEAPKINNAAKSVNEDSKVVPAPGVMNQSQMDSIKQGLNKEKTRRNK